MQRQRCSGRDYNLETGNSAKLQAAQPHGAALKPSDIHSTPMQPFVLPDPDTSSATLSLVC